MSFIHVILENEKKMKYIFMSVKYSIQLTYAISMALAKLKKKYAWPKWLE